MDTSNVDSVFVGGKALSATAIVGVDLNQSKNGL
jgi:hypothetical protein